MRKKADAASDQLRQFRDVNAELAGLGINPPDNWNQMMPNDKIKWLDDQKSQIDKTQALTKTLQENNSAQEETINDMNASGIVPNAPQSQSGGGVRASARFNLKKYSQDMSMPEASMGLPPDVPQEQDETPINVQDVREALDEFVNTRKMMGQDDQESIAGAIGDATEYFMANITSPNMKTEDPKGNLADQDQNVKNAIEGYYSAVEETEKDAAAAFIAKYAFPENNKSAGVPAVKDTGVVPMDISASVEKTNKLIQKMAQKDAQTAQKKPQTFNLRKEAQHQTVDNVITFGPEQTTIDQFYGLPISRWNLVERNKGFGLRLREVHDLDWEKVWRECVMDKYDPLYLERRFDVDKNVPPTNNYQLQPGEKRRITPAEYGNTEARLEAARTKMNKDRGYTPSEKGNVFNWKEAKTKTAQPAPVPPLQSAPIKSEPVKGGQVWKCRFCGTNLETQKVPGSLLTDPSDRCKKCGGMQTQNGLGGAIDMGVKTAPDPRKAATEQSAEKIAGDGIFFDGEQFVVLANGKKFTGKTYIEAKSKSEKKEEKKEEKQLKYELDQPQEFKQVLNKPAVPPKAPAPLTPEQIQRQKEVARSADALGL